MSDTTKLRTDGSQCQGAAGGLRNEGGGDEGGGDEGGGRQLWNKFHSTLLRRVELKIRDEQLALAVGGAVAGPHQLLAIRREDR